MVYVYRVLTLRDLNPDVDQILTIRAEQASQPSTGISHVVCGVVTGATLVVALLYFCALYFIWRYARLNPRALNKPSGIRLQKYAPIVYVFVVCSSLAEIALCVWLLLQYKIHQNLPNNEILIGSRFLLFCASWSTLTAGTYSLLFLHPVWSTHVVSSIGAQAIWVFFTWLFWIVGAGIVNNAMPFLMTTGNCTGIIYCGQVQSLFAIAVLEIIILTGGMVTMMYLAWSSTRDLLRPAASR
ncbi:hypothetical protein BDN72DRAFT_839746 [Pluteus cervinus]|uniref:Uncharacterized protein n=1 Tax=Pluteus cervinus TaxID=181527 RepID=A0ACD3AWN8_9AGAR|nr:hypothetical protein BDN72DRAFT_839746 [Pluteus cervinus]